MRVPLLAAAFVAAAAAIFFLRPEPTPGPPMRDFEAYYSAGATWNGGADPYSQAIWQRERTLDGVDGSRYEALPFVAPPAVLPLFGLIARLPFSAANAVWRSVLAACIAGIALLALALAGIRLTAHSFAAIALAALGFGPMTSALALGQLALPAMLFATLAVVWPAAGVFAWIQPNIGLALVALAWARRGAAAFAAAATAFAALCVAVIGISGVQRYVQVVHRHSLAERFSAIQITPGAIAFGFGASPQTAAAMGTAVAIAAACCWFFLMRMTQDRIARFCATCALLPLAMPFFHEHDLLVLFVPAVVYTIRCDRRLWPAATLGALLAATDWLGLAQRPGGMPQTLLLIGALGCALAALRDDVRPAMLAVPAAALAAIAVAALAAHAHPAPVWPDAMGALPRNVASLDIASAWNAQQRASGLYAQQPVWAALRMLSLLGCAMLAGTIALSSKSPADSKNPSPVPA